MDHCGWKLVYYNSWVGFGVKDRAFRHSLTLPYNKGEVRKAHETMILITTSP